MTEIGSTVQRKVVSRKKTHRKSLNIIRCFERLFSKEFSRKVRGLRAWLSSEFANFYAAPSFLCLKSSIISRKIIFRIKHCILYKVYEKYFRGLYILYLYFDEMSQKRQNSWKKRSQEKISNFVVSRVSRYAENKSFDIFRFFFYESIIDRFGEVF